MKGRAKPGMGAPACSKTVMYMGHASWDGGGGDEEWFGWSLSKGRLASLFAEMSRAEVVAARWG